MLTTTLGVRELTRAADADFILRFQKFAHGQLDPAGQTLYAAAQDRLIRAVDLATHEITRTSTGKMGTPLRHRRVMPSSGALSPDGRLWYLSIKIPNNGEQWIEQILVFDTHVMSMVSVITPVRPFWGLALSSDGSQLYASEPDMKSIMVIDTATRRMIRALSVGAKPSIIFTVKAPDRRPSSYRSPPFAGFDCR